MARYHYSPLAQSHVRLLSIEPEGSQGTDSPLTCYIEHAALDATLEYSALSYTWGDGGLAESLSIASSSSEGETRLPITANCKAALLALRKNGQTAIWVDAICINQGDDAERSAQVAKMREIYSQARKVYVFLGQVVVDDLQWFYEFNELPLKGVKLFNENENDPEASAIMINISSPEWNEKAFSGSNRFVENLLTNPYFSRVWILQELACAKDADALFSNTTPRSWSLLMQYLKASDASRKVYGSQITVELPRVMSLQGDTDPTKFSLLRLLLETRQANATDKRDKVYALLGIASDAASVAVPIDYAASIANVFTTTTQRLIASSGTLAVLTAVCEGSSLPNLPSWTPDFGLKPTRSNLAQHPRTGEDAGFAASSGRQFSGTCDGPGALKCKAKLVGHVVALSEPHRSPPDPKYWGIWTFSAQTIGFRNLMTLSGERQLFALHNFGRYWGDNMLDTVARTVVAYKADPAYPEMAQRLPKAQDIDASSLMFHPEYHWIQWSRGQTLPERDWYQEFMEHHCRGRRLAVTSSSHLVLVSDQTKMTDSLYVLEGFSMPVILRSTQTGAFQLIGESYCHGIMEGQLNNDPAIADLVGDWQEISIV